MNVRSVRFFAVLCLAAARAQSPKPARPPKSEIEEIKATGCVRKAVVARCLLVTTLDGKSTYSFIAAPKPEVGSVITLQGTAHHGAAVCREGVQIDVTDWDSTGEKCVE